MRMPSGVTDQYIYFVAVDATDLKTRETGLNTWTVYRSRNGGAAAAWTTPTINETDTTNMPGVYELLVDEDTTIDAGDDSQEMCIHITHAGMAPVTRVIELYRPKFTAGSTLAVTDIVSSGAITTNAGAVETVTTATNVTTVNGLAANVITAASMNADAAAEIADAVWDEDATAHQTQGTFGQAIGDPAADTNTIYAAVVTNATGATIAHDIVTVDGIVDDILLDTAEIGAAGAGLTNINLPDQTMNITGNITGNLSGSVGSVTGLTASNLDVAVSTLATAVDLATVAGYLDTEVAAILADTNELQTDWANGGRLDLLVDAIKAKTDSLAFTVAGQVDANIQYVNDVQVTGTGAPGDEWGP